MPPDVLVNMERFLADESVDYRIVTSLREDGYHVEAIIDQNPSISDKQVLEVANNLKAILITEDKDFGELTYRLQYPNHGILLIRMGGLPIQERLQKIKRAIKDHLPELRNRFSVITQEKLRIRDLL